MILTSDSECLTYNKGNPFDSRHKAICVGWKEDDNKTECFFDLTKPKKNLDEYEVCIFFNAKYDIHVYRKLGWKLPKRIYCAQIAEFLLSGQRERYPSLEQAAIKYGLGHKIDVVKLEYWDKGINTDQVPPNILGDYCKQDVELTFQVYQHQKALLEKQPDLYKLFKLMCQDLLVLEEMEWNGLVYDEALCQQRSAEIDIELVSIKEHLAATYPELAINFGSGDQLSTFLYGGNIYEEGKEHIGFFKTGDKKGQPKYKNIEIVHTLPRLIEPLKGSELKKEGYYATDEATLRKLKGPAAKKYVGPLLRLAELEKLNSTYYQGLPKKALVMNWPKGKIHGQFNQVVAQTGRLSSSGPNLQNFSGDCLDIFISRHD